MPLGAPLPHVMLGNTLASRTVFLCLLAHLRGSIFTVEQPRLSKLQDHPHFQYMMRFLLQRGIKLQRHEVHLGEYGAESLKPIWLYAPLEINLPCGTCEHTANPAAAPTYYTCHGSKNWICLFACQLKNSLCEFTQVCRLQRDKTKHRWTRPEIEPDLSINVAWHMQQVRYNTMHHTYIRHLAHPCFVFRFGRAMASWWSSNWTSNRRDCMKCHKALSVLFSISLLPLSLSVCLSVSLSLCLSVSLSLCLSLSLSLSLSRSCFLVMPVCKMLLHFGTDCGCSVKDVSSQTWSSVTFWCGAVHT